jgi:multidrug efflux pump subunit AcrB
MTSRHQTYFGAILVLLLVFGGRLRPTPAPDRAAPVEARPVQTSAWPAITVEASYPGANTQVVADTVAAPIEQQVNGVPGMLYLRSRCGGDGSYTLTVAFRQGVDLDRAQKLVQDRAGLAAPILPDVVKRGGLTVRKKSPGVLQIATLTSPGGRYDNLYLSNYALTQVKDELARLPGVGGVVLSGQQDFSLRVWLDPDKLASRNLTAGAVLKALREQNAKVLADDVGKARKKGDPFQLTIPAGRLSDPDQLAGIILKVDARGAITHVADVAQVEWGRSHAERRASLNGQPAVALSVYPTAQARPREVSAAVRGLVSRLRSRLPEGMSLEVACDFTPSPAAGEYLLLDPDMPAGISTERALSILRHGESLLDKIKGVQDVLILSDNPFDQRRDRACLVVRLTPAGGRQASREELARAVRRQLAQLKQIQVRLHNLSGQGGFAHLGYPVDLAIHGPEADRVRELAGKFAARLRQGNKLTDVWADPESAPQRQVVLDLDRQRMAKEGLQFGDIRDTLQAYMGSLQVNDFNRFGRSWQVVVQAGSGSGKPAEQIKQLKVRTGTGEMVSLGNVVKVREIEAPLAIDLLDGRPIVEVTASLAAGVSLAEARSLLEAQAEEARRELHLSAAYRLTWLRQMAPAK